MDSPEKNSLRKIRRLRKWWVVAISMLMLSVALFYVGPWSIVVREIIMLGGVGVYGIATLMVVFSRCPRCGHLFHNVLGFRNPFSRLCGHCGLPVDGDGLPE
jgi:hypothetical protein